MIQDLPITAFAPDITETVKLNAVTIIIGETGSGKTTQIPQVGFTAQSFAASLACKARHIDSLTFPTALNGWLAFDERSSSDMIECCCRF